ncbi:FliO/MopB family protein [Myxococcota bacterium]
MTQALPLTLALLLCAAQEPPSKSPPPDAERGLEADEASGPPPSAWDRQQRNETESDTEEGKEDISWGTQLVKTVVALLIVVGLIYLLFKVGLAKFIGMAAIRGSKSLRVLERVQLDARHALLIVEIEGHKRFLIGTGEQGIQMLAHLDQDTNPPKTSFQEAMAQTANPAPDASTPGREKSRG